MIYFIYDRAGTSLMNSRGVAVDLFCGCGGISAGLRNAGFRVLAGVDIEKHFIQTFRENFPESKCLELDLANTSPRDLMELLRLKRGQLDLLAGGPPCQGFSKNVPRRHRSVDLETNRLIYTFPVVLQPFASQTYSYGKRGGDEE